MPAVTFQATAEVGPSSADWKTTGPLTVVPGNQTVPFDVLWLPTRLQVNGTLTSAPGVPLPGPIQIGVSARNTGGDLILYTQPAVTPAPQPTISTSESTLPSTSTGAMSSAMPATLAARRSVMRWWFSGS